MALKDVLQRFSAGFAQRLQPAEQLASMGLTPDQVAAAQTQALRRFGMGMLSNIGTGNPLGAGLGQAFQAAGPAYTQELGQVAEMGRRSRAEKTDAQRRAEDVAYRNSRAAAEDSQFEQTFKQRGEIAANQITASMRELEAKVAAEIALKKTPDPKDAQAIREANNKLEVIRQLSRVPFKNMTENQQGLWNWATGGAAGDLIRAQRPASGLGGFDFGGLGGVGAAAGAGAPPGTVVAPAAPSNDGFRIVGVR